MDINGSKTILACIKKACMKYVKPLQLARGTKKHINGERIASKSHYRTLQQNFNLFMGY